MGFVMAGFTAILVVVFVIWLLSLAKSRSADRTEKAREDAEEAERRRRQQEEARLRTIGVRLHCMGCGLDFLGPLTDDGCPNCHLQSLVVTEDEFHRTQQNQFGS